MYQKDVENGIKTLGVSFEIYVRVRIPSVSKIGVKAELKFV